jgi:hypothetical protein
MVGRINHSDKELADCSKIEQAGAKFTTKLLFFLPK